MRGAGPPSSQPSGTPETPASQARGGLLPCRTCVFRAGRRAVSSGLHPRRRRRSRGPTEVLEVLDRLAVSHLASWLDGGWGRRCHHRRADATPPRLDLVIARRDCPRAQAALAAHGARGTRRRRHGPRRSSAPFRARDAGAADRLAGPAVLGCPLAERAGYLTATR